MLIITYLALTISFSSVRIKIFCFVSKLIIMIHVLYWSYGCQQAILLDWKNPNIGDNPVP